jgi:hypothetical protein
MACKSCKKKTKKHNPSNLITGIKNNKGLKFISSTKGKITVFFVLLLCWPIIAICLPILFYWAIFGLPKRRNKLENEQQHQDTDTTQQSRQIYQYQT